MSEKNPKNPKSDRKPTKEEAQVAAAALQALHEGNVRQARLLNKILEMTQEDNDNESQGS
ncbi:hypothetical protein G3I59_05140 [Amycolatopsis rubida]|uniref:Uncharacterized protein n=1 Tax=Amycolatopsis rubida TaxID=112413 RepID=A0ABX0BKW7_9PSEU|nr:MULTISPECIES: hypothetical protein [Amycolatopsis]MYW90018.1 hypothetical protein [Amycolatopsis rubida]NEC54995.1 hypothetical protein [Amycolatopsis rubida]